MFVVWAVVAERTVVDEFNGLVVAVEAGRAMTTARDDSIGRDEGSGCLDLPAEVRGVEWTLQDSLVNPAKLGEGERLAQERVRNAAVFEFGA